MMPWKSGPSPIGISTGTTLGVRCAFTSSKTRSKSACSLSIAETNSIRGQVQLIAELPDLLGAHLDPAGAAQHHDRGVGRVQAGHDLAEVVEVAGGVDQVDLGVEPLGVAEAEADGVLAFDFVGGVVGEGGAVLDRCRGAGSSRTTQASASTSDVLPLAPWPTNATFRMALEP